MKIMHRKKAQEEIIGFVAILILIAVIFLGFIAFSLRQKPSEQQDRRVANLLEAMLGVTTDCAVSFEPQFSTLQDLIKNCYYGERCSNGRGACQYLNEISEGMLIAAEGDLSLERGRQLNYFEFNASYAIEGQQFVRRPSAGLAHVKRGVCSGSSIGAQQFIPLDEGSIQVTLIFCY